MDKLTLSKHYFEKIRSPVFLPVWDDRYVTKGFREILKEGEEIGLNGIFLRFYVFPTGPIAIQATQALECYI